jgi:hypothetical protein
VIFRGDERDVSRCLAVDTAEKIGDAGKTRS